MSQSAAVCRTSKPCQRTHYSYATMTCTFADVLRPLEGDVYNFTWRRRRRRFRDGVLFLPRTSPASSQGRKSRTLGRQRFAALRDFLQPLSVLRGPVAAVPAWRPLLLPRRHETAFSTRPSHLPPSLIQTHFSIHIVIISRRQLSSEHLSENLIDVKFDAPRKEWGLAHAPIARSRGPA